MCNFERKKFHTRRARTRTLTHERAYTTGVGERRSVCNKEKVEKGEEKKKQQQNNNRGTVGRNDVTEG